MRQTFVIIFTVIVMIPIFFLLEGTKITQDSLAVIDAKIVKAGDCLLYGKSTKGDCTDGIFDLLEAAANSAPLGKQLEDIGKKLSAVLEEAKKTSLFNPKITEQLKQIYRQINNGQDYKSFAIKDVEAAIKIGKELLESSRQQLKEKKIDDAIKSLISLVLLIITPVK